MMDQIQSKLGILLLLLISSTFFVGCEAENYATAEEKVVIEQYDIEISEARKLYDAKVLILNEKFDELKEGVKDPESIPDLLSSYKVALEAAKEAREAVLSLELAQNEVLDDIRKRTIEGPSGLIAPFIVNTPLAPLAPFIPVAAALASQLAFKRSREHLGKSLKSLGRFQLGDAFLDYLKALGFKHSAEDPIEVIKGAKQAALDKGDTEMAIKIDATIAALDSEEDER